MLTISVGKSKNETNWRPESIAWDDLCIRLSRTRYTAETVEEYAAMSKAEKGAAKDVGGFVGGEFANGSRKNQSLRYRSMIALDIDFGETNTPDIVEMVCDLNGWDCLMHTTHSHTPESPRYRLFFPLSRNVSKEEYEPIARRVADEIGIELFDDTTYQAARLMFWPSTPKDGEFKFWRFYGGAVDADEILGGFVNWRDQHEWAFSSRHTKEIHQSAEKQKDPRSKGGIVGAFCRVYDVPSAIETYLGGVYLPTDDDDRWTYSGGSTVGGLVIYDDGLFCYSHHDTDPACGLMCNAFDLVGVHLFPGVDSAERYEKMKTVCANDEAVRHMLDEMTYNAAVAEFREGGESDTLRRYDDDLTEQGNAVRLKDTYFDRMRFCGSLGWCVWDGELWNTDADQTDAMMMVMNQSDRLKDEAERAMQLAPKPGATVKRMDWPPEYKRAVALVAWAEKSRNAYNMSNTLKAAKSLMAIKDSVFDADPWVVNTPGGLVDLRTGVIREHRVDDFCTMMTAVTPDWECEHEKWDAFLYGVTGGDPDFATYLQTLAGMAMVGKVYEEGLVIAYGSGSNGKSTLFDLWVKLMGTYADVVRNEIILGNRYGGDVAGQNKLRGKRLVIMGELEDNQSMNGATLKRLTSHDMIQANAKYKEPITFVPTHTLILHTNHLPRLKAVDTGTTRRIAVAPFTMTITPEKKITNFGDVLFDAEGPAILAWMVDGAKRFYAEGMRLEKPKIVREATQSYIGEEDTVGQFISDCCVVGGAESCGASDLFAAFMEWTNKNGVHWYKGNKGFKADMIDKGYEHMKRKTGAIYVGISLKSVVDDLL